MAVGGSSRRTAGRCSKIFVIGGIGCVVVVGVVAFGIFRVFSSVIGEVMNEETFEVSEPRAFDPFAGLGEVQPQVGSAASLYIGARRQQSV